MKKGDNANHSVMDSICEQVKYSVADEHFRRFDET